MNMLENREINRYHRHAEALAHAVDDPEAFAAAVEIHRHFGDALARRARELTNPALPERSRFSWRDLAAATGLAKSTLFEVFGVHADRTRRSPLGLVVRDITEQTATAKDLANAEQLRRVADEKDRQATADREKREAAVRREIEKRQARQDLRNWLAENAGIFTNAAS